MNTKNRKLTITASIFIILKLVISIMLFVIAIANLDYISWYFFQLFFTNGITWLNYKTFKTFFSILGIYSAFAIVFDTALLFIYLNIIYKPATFFKKKRNKFVILVILTFIFGGLISGFLTLYALLINIDEYKEIELTEEQLNNLPDTALLQIQRVNELFALSLLTLEQHDLLISHIINSNNEFDFNAFYEQKMQQYEQNKLNNENK